MPNTDLVVFLNNRLEHVISLGVIQRAVDHFVDRTLAEISLGGRLFFVPTIVDV